MNTTPSIEIRSAAEALIRCVEMWPDASDVPLNVRLTAGELKRTLNADATHAKRVASDAPGVEAPRPLPETMSRDEMLKHYSVYANLCAHEALQYQKRIRDLEEALRKALAPSGVAEVPPAAAENESLPASVWLNDIGTSQTLSFAPKQGAYEHHEYVRAAPPRGSVGGDDDLHGAIREGMERAAKIVDDADVVECRRNTYYAQLGDARATLLAAAKEIREAAASLAKTAPLGDAKDGERYRWLREQKEVRGTERLLPMARVIDTEHGVGYIEIFTADQLDAAIDAAIASTPTPTETKS